MIFKHEYVERPAIHFNAMPTPSYDDFETVTLSVAIYGTGTSIESDMPTENARQFACEIIAACELVEEER